MGKTKEVENSAAQDEVRQRKKSETAKKKEVKETTEKKEKKQKPSSPKEKRTPKVSQRKENKRERRQERTRSKKSVAQHSPLHSFWVEILRPWARRHYIIVTLSISASLLAFALYISVDKLDHRKQELKLPTVTDKVSFDISVENGSSGKLVIGLYGNNCPKTVENFIKLCTHEKGYGYKGSRFHVIFPGHMIMGGDIVNNNGTSGRSALDESFEEENMKLKHSVPGTVGMIGLKNNKDSKKSSQFYITFAPAKDFDGVSVVFGRVVEGIDFLKSLELLPTDKQSFRPTVQVTITDAKQLQSTDA